jgi:hypothetical protein
MAFLSIIVLIFSSIQRVIFCLGSGHRTASGFNILPVGLRCYSSISLCRPEVYCASLVDPC